MIKNKNVIISLLGLYLLLMFFYNLANMFYAGEQIEIFWLCNHVPLIVSLAILFRNQRVLIAEVSLLFSASLVWTIDLIFLFTTGMSLIGDIRFFWDQNIFYQISTVLIHTTFIPVTFLAIFLIGKKIKLSQTLPIFLLHWFFLIIIAYTYRKYNFNCIIDSCINFIPNFKLHFITAILCYGLIMIVINLMINKFLKKY